MFRVWFRKGHRLFSTASILAILIAVLHTTALLNVPSDPSWTNAVDAMKVATPGRDIPRPSLFDVVVGHGYK